MSKPIGDVVDESLELWFLVLDKLEAKASATNRVYTPGALLENSRALAISISIEVNRGGDIDMGAITNPTKMIDKSKKSCMLKEASLHFPVGGVAFGNTTPEKPPVVPVEEHGNINVYAITRRLWERGELPQGAFVDITRHIKQSMNLPPSFKLTVKDLNKAIDTGKLPEPELYYILKNNGVIE